MHPIVVVLDLVGTFAFAISGGTLAVRKQFDLFGVLVLSFTAAVTGGIVRDVLIGATPPVALANWHYLGVSCVAGLAAFYRGAAIERMENPVQLFDAVGLGVFAVTGATKALEAGLAPGGAMLLGMVTGIGGGMARDILAMRIPVVLQSDLYAVAALAGAAVVVVGAQMDWPQPVLLVCGAVLVFFLRFMAVRHGWRLPTAR